VVHRPSECMAKHQCRSDFLRVGRVLIRVMLVWYWERDLQPGPDVGGIRVGEEQWRVRKRVCRVTASSQVSTGLNKSERAPIYSVERREKDVPTHRRRDVDASGPRNSGLWYASSTTGDSGTTRSPGLMAACVGV
jgi:hypothetical protein